MAFSTRQNRPSYGRCDSYFVETDNYDWYDRRAQERERARLQAKERQHVIAGELSRITADEYQDDVLDQMEFMEPMTLPDVNSIDIQTEIQWFMRPFLMDFLVEAHAAFRLLPDTLYLTVNLLDRYCSKRIVYKRHYQLVGSAALLIAAKYGDRKDRVPQIKELRAMCCSLYEEEMFTQMEWHLLQTLDWVIGHPTVDSFLQVALSDTSYDPEVEHMSWYISELALFHKEFVSVLPSTMARSSLALARALLNRPSPKQSGWADVYDASLVTKLYAQLQQPSNVVAKKYSAYQLSAVSVTARVFVESQNEVERQRELAASAPTVEVWPVAEAQQTNSPQTPHKVQSSYIMSNGMYTPPITPENEHGHMATYAKQNNSLPSMQQTPTPTPPSSVDHRPHQHYQPCMMQTSQDAAFWVS